MRLFRTRPRRKIHTFGDSHCHAGWKKVRSRSVEVHTHRLGPRLMHSFGKLGLELLDLADYRLDADDVACFCFGEIDCRGHVQRLAETDHESVIDQVVDAYFDAIELNRARTAARTIAVYNVVPPVHRDRVWEDPAFPFLGSDAERLHYVCYMNERLRAGCRARGLVFVDVYTDYSDVDGFLDPQLSDGKIHIRNPRPLTRFLERHLGVLKN